MAGGTSDAGPDDSNGSKDPSVSYRYWVNSRGDAGEAAPAPQPRKLTPEEAATMHHSSSQGSLWNQGGTWEERSLNDWAKAQMTELMALQLSVEAQGQQYQLTTQLDSLSGDTTIVVVRNKRKHGYLLDISLSFKGRGPGEGDTAPLLEGSMRIHEATFGDVDGTHLEVTLDVGKSGVPESTKSAVEAQLTGAFLPTIQARLENFERALLQR